MWLRVESGGGGCTQPYCVHKRMGCLSCADVSSPLDLLVSTLLICLMLQGGAFKRKSALAAADMIIKIRRYVYAEDWQELFEHCIFVNYDWLLHRLKNNTLKRFPPMYQSSHCPSPPPFCALIEVFTQCSICVSQGHVLFIKLFLCCFYFNLLVADDRAILQ